MKNTELANKIQCTLLEMGASDVGFCEHTEAFRGLHHSVSIVVALSKEIVREISDRPTPMYFHHYRTVNFLLDQLALRAGLLLAGAGYEYYPIAASQSINTEGHCFAGAFSHKEAAVGSGLGRIGRNALFLHERFGAAVRLATVFTDCDLGSGLARQQGCGSCRACVAACPAQAILGGDYVLGAPRETIFDPQACSRYMKDQFQQIGRGSVCGICMKTCMEVQGKLKNT